MVKFQVLTGSQKYYHLTNNPNFSLISGFQQADQEFGSGLYVTHERNVKFWDTALTAGSSRRQFTVPIFAQGLRVIHEEAFPPHKVMIKDLKDAGYTGDIIMSAMVRGNTFNRNKYDVTIKREWAKLQGLDGIIPSKDRHEAAQLILINPNVRCGELIRVSDFYRKK